jgi:hypothetical protein
VLTATTPNGSSGTGGVVNEEGWYIDPYGRHEARWISEGTPTALVRDGGVESQDPPPDQPVTVEMEPWRAGDVHDASDLKRADDADAQGFDPKELTQAAFEAIDESTTG